MSDEYSAIRYGVREGVAEVTLHRPEAANAIDATLAYELHQVALRCDADPAVRAVLITGTGRFFCAGGDLRAFAARGDDLPRFLKSVTGDLHLAISRFHRMDAPVIMAVNGPAAGAGFSLAMAGNLALCATSASFTMAYTRAGLTPDGSSTYFLPRIVGVRRATWLTLTNATLTAADALDWGIVQQVVPDADLLDTARALASQLAQGPTHAFGVATRLLDDGLNATLETAMEDEAQAIAAISRTADAQEGIAAFLEKRVPRYRGP